MAQKNLRQKAAAGMVWTAVQRYSTMIIQFISGIILARLLTAYDYGCIGMLMIFMTLAEAFIDGGFGSALIQKKRPTQEDYSTIFWWNMGMAALMYAILFLISPWVARFYDIPLLCDVLRVQGLVLFLYAFNIIQRNQLRKFMNFKVIAIVTIVTSVVALVVTVWMAYRGFGVWSLVAQNMVTAAIPSLVFWFYLKWRPSWVFSLPSFKELFGFGFFMFLSHLVNQFSSQVQGLLIGKVYNASTMGYYSKAQGTEKLASHSISQVMTQVTFPLYAEVQDDKTALGNMIKRLSLTVAFITFPLMFILMLDAKPIFVLLYSERWLNSVPYFQVLCFSGLAVCMHAVNLQSISAIGKSNVMFYGVLVKRAVGLTAVVGGLFLFGMKGLLVGVVINSWFSAFYNILLVSRYIGYHWTRQLLDLAPIALVAALAALVAYAAGAFLKLGMYADGAVKLLVFVTIYMGWAILFNPGPYEYVKSIIIPLWEKFRSRIIRNKTDQ